MATETTADIDVVDETSRDAVATRHRASGPVSSGRRTLIIGGLVLALLVAAAVSGWVRSTRQSSLADSLAAAQTAACDNAKA